MVTSKDLQKLFGKCGELITANFDTNEFGAYLGTATIIYSRASSATRAIKDYNNARIDNRPLQVLYAQQPSIQLPSGSRVEMPQRATPNGIRRTNNRIGKERPGRTLNLRGRGGRSQNKDRSVPKKN